MKKKTRIVIGVILAVVLVSIVCLAVANKDVWFQHKVKIMKGTCEEVYINGELTTEPCEEIVQENIWAKTDYPEINIVGIEQINSNLSVQESNIVNLQTKKSSL